MIGSVKTDGFEGSIEPRAKHLRDGVAADEFDECKLTVGNLDCNARENFVKLREIFRQRLAAPIDNGACAQTHLLPINPTRRNIRRLVIDRRIRQSDKLFGIVTLCAWGFHEITADEVIDRRISTRDRVSPGTALD